MTSMFQNHLRIPIRCLNIGCSFKFILKVGVEESIVNAPLISEVSFKQLIRDL
jgi:hypothetical protein